jgi:hypothetical protein
MMKRSRLTDIGWAQRANRSRSLRRQRGFICPLLLGGSALRATLNLDFQNAFESAIAFIAANGAAARTGTGMLYDASLGAWRYGDHNLLKSSEDTRTAAEGNPVTAWVATRVTTTLTGGVSQVRETTGAGTHQLSQYTFFTPGTNEPVVASCRIVPQGRTNVQLKLYAGANNITSFFTLTGAGAVHDSANAGAGAVGTCTITADGDGYICTLFGIVSTSSSAATSFEIYLSTGGTTISYTPADTTLGVDVSYAMVHKGTRLLTYRKTTTAAYYHPRQHYHMVSGATGFLGEAQAINSMLSSTDMRASGGGNPITSWEGNVDVTVELASGTSPIGTNTANLVTEGTAGTAVVSQSNTITAGNTQTGSFFVKPSGAGAPQWVCAQFNSGGGTTRAYFDITNGVAGSNDASAGTHTYVAHRIDADVGGWYRLQLTVTIATDTACSWNIGSATANSNATRVNDATYLLYWGQREVGSFATSPIDTYGAAVTRVADAPYVSTSSFGFSNTEGTFVARFVSASTTGRVAVVENASAALLTNGINVDVTAGSYRTEGYSGGGAAQWSITGGTYVAKSVETMAMSYKANDVGLAADGAALGTPDTSATIPATETTRVWIGNWNGANNTSIVSLKYYPRKIANASLPGRAV